MATPKTCPQCSAPLAVKTVGRFQDKFMVCHYCNFKVDIPDEFEVSRAAESRSRDGTRRRVEVKYRRRDLAPGERDPKEKMDAILETFKQKGIPVDNRVINRVRKRSCSKATEQTGRTFTEIADKYLDPEFSDLARQVDFSMDSAKEGTEHLFENSEAIEKTALFITERRVSNMINTSKIVLYLAGAVGFIVFIFWLLS